MKKILLIIVIGIPVFIIASIYYTIRCLSITCGIVIGLLTVNFVFNEFLKIELLKERRNYGQ